MITETRPTYRTSTVRRMPLAQPTPPPATPRRNKRIARRAARVNWDLRPALPIVFSGTLAVVAVGVYLSMYALWFDDNLTISQKQKEMTRAKAEEAYLLTKISEEELRPNVERRAREMQMLPPDPTIRQVSFPRSPTKGVLADNR